MAKRLADRLSAARHRQFVGRAAELELFTSALAADDVPFLILHVFGPGGVGKTTLLGEFASACAAAGIPAWRIDGRNIDSVPESFIATLGAALGAQSPQSPLDALAAHGGRQVILVDTYETLNPLDTARVANLNICGTSGINQRVQNGMSIVRHRKQLTGFLTLEFDADFVEEVYRLWNVEAAQDFVDGVA